MFTNSVSLCRLNNSVLLTIVVLLIAVGAVSAQTFTNSVGMKMVSIPAGTFTMGSSLKLPKFEQPTVDDPFTSFDDVADYKGWHDSLIMEIVSAAGVRIDEYPSCPVTLSGFKMSSTEVTQAQWYAIMGTNPSRFLSDKLGFDSRNNPVDWVSWNEAVSFCEKLSLKEGESYRLPTEAEWEYACRGGTKGKTYFPIGTIGEYAWYDNNSAEKTHPVAMKKPNAFGLYDMSGNVCEWCYDLYGPYSSAAAIDPVGPFSSQDGYRVLRGGSVGGDASRHRSAQRDNWPPDSRGDYVGFRVVLRH